MTYIRSEHIGVIDQVQGQDGLIVAKFFFYLSRWSGSLKTCKKKKKAIQHPGILTKQAWSIKDLLRGFQGNFSCGIPRELARGQDGRSFSIWVSNHSTGFGSSRLFTEQGILVKLDTS